MDWRDPANYAYTATHDDVHWAWEFLRRNKEYRDAWELELPDGLERNKREQQVKNLPIDHPSFFLVVGGPEPLDTWGLYRWLNPMNAVPTNLASHWPPRFPVRWHVGHSPGPEGWTPSGNSNEWRPPFRGIPKDSRPAVGPGQCAVIFELGHSLTPQLDAAKVELQGLQELWLEELARTGTAKPVRKRRRPYTNFALYLQVLDAKEAGANLADIAKHCHGINSKDAAKETLKQAKDWVNNYQTLLEPYKPS